MDEQMPLQFRIDELTRACGKFIISPKNYSNS